MNNSTCNICGASFYCKPSHKARGWGKYCSNYCKNLSQLRGSEVTCEVCKKIIHRSLSQQNHSKSKRFFCSHACQIGWRNALYVGEKHPNWNNGKNSYRKILKRKSKEIYCEMCMIPDIRVLAVHHLDHDRTNNKMENLHWLCLNCHHLAHHDEGFEKTLKSHIIQKP